MDQVLKLAIERCIADPTGEPARIISANATHGGCINTTETVTLSDQRQYFVKTNANVPQDFFERESEGLQAIAAANVIRVPAVVGCGCFRSTKFLVLEAIDSGRPAADFSERFGQQLAELHRRTTRDTFGFSHSNYLGSTVQRNDWCSNWIDFWRDYRLGFQLELARQNGFATADFNRLADRIMHRLDGFLTSDEPASLIHGDLWSGNFMVEDRGEPVLIDPAVYYGHREAEFGMTTLFGGFDAKFYSAYSDTWPLESGSNERIEIYRLYHLLNHLNLFGGSYRSQCVEIMKKYA